MEHVNSHPKEIIDNLPTARAISSTTAATPIVVTTAVPHGIKTGSYVLVEGAQDSAANFVYRVGTITSTTLVLEGSVGTTPGGAQGSIFDLGFGVTYEVPTDLVDDMDAATLNVTLEHLGDRTAFLELQAHGIQQNELLPGGGAHSLTWDVSLGRVLRLATDTAGASVELSFKNVVPGGRYALILEHVHSGNVSMVWDGPSSLLHKFTDSEAIDGQPRPGSGISCWTGEAYLLSSGGGATVAIRWTSVGNVGPGSLRHRWAENQPGAASVRVDAAGGFVMTATGTINELVSFPFEGFPLWTTPEAPYVIEGASIELTGNVTANADPQNIIYTLLINGVPLVTGGDSLAGWGGTTYVVGGSNLSIFATPSDLLDGSLGDNGTGNVGAISSNGQLAVTSEGSVTSFWRQTLVLRIGPSVARTLTIPYKVRVWGRLLAA